MWFNPAELLSKTPCPLAIPATLRFCDEIEPEKSQNRKNRSPVELGITKSEFIEELQADELDATPQTEIIEELLSSSVANDTIKSIVASCSQCVHFKSLNSHDRGAGTCNAGVQSPGINWWSDTKHQCLKFTSRDWWIVNAGESYSITTIPPSTYAEMLELEPEAIIIQPTTVCRLKDE
ncbi:MAG: hypothetical protein HOO92_04575 [Methylococcaceae bacterium]|nr:hypothetical protein [Methylococcaceae bacterium]